MCLRPFPCLINLYLLNRPTAQVRPRLKIPTLRAGRMKRLLVQAGRVHREHTKIAGQQSGKKERHGHGTYGATRY
eukprot:IDg8172t1